MKKRISMLILIFSVVYLAAAFASDMIKVSIDPPGAEVGPQAVITGKVSGTSSDIYVLVHPLQSKLYWTQRIPSPRNRDGSWRTLCYFGNKSVGIDEAFEIVAIITSKKLTEGQTLTALPEDAIRSDIIMVKRTN